MSKRQQEGKLGEEELVVAKSKPMMSLVSKIASRSPTALGSSASKFRSFGHRETRRERCERCECKTQHRVLKCGIRMKTLVPALGNQLRKRLNTLSETWVTSSQF